MGGGPGNADTLKALASQLAEDFTVVTYDRRGYSRSQMKDPPEPTGIPRHGDDALQRARLARHLGVPLKDPPGNHAGVVQHPAQFATPLRSLLQPPVSGGIRTTEHQEGVTK
jgi:pimeloyl-ACP methyl ester carboxylesterase